MQVVANDVDSHEMIPGHLLEDILGKPGRIMGAILKRSDEIRHDPTDTCMHQPDIKGDVREVDSDDIWKIKGPSAPSAIDLSRRGEVLDTMGIGRQLVFPTTAIAAMMVGVMDDLGFKMRFGGDSDTLEGMSKPDFAKSFLSAYNDWVLSKPVADADRIRMVGIVPTSENLDEMMATAKKLVDSGVRAVYVQADTPPGGFSPAHSALDPFWRLFEEANVPVTLHIGTEYGFLDSRWAFAETFSDLFQSPELPNNSIQMFSTIHMAVDNYVSALVLGGVFERFPNLRVGLLEVGAHWLGPASKRMDMFVDVFPGAAAARFSMKPSEYLARNVRISPFNFEPVDEYFRDYPNLADVFCYSTDYPHVEGIKDSLNKMKAKIDPLGKTVSDKFFRTNAEWLLPV